MNVLDKAGLTKLWAKIKEKFATKSELGLYVGGTNSLKATYTNTDLEVTLNNANGSPNTALTIGCATTTLAGVMSPEDKKTLNIVSDGKYQNMSYILYSELKNLRDNSQLVKGRYYRITDFVTTVVQKDARSAGHAFDIIVLATSPNILNENAKVVKHEGDTYFANSNLDAWEIKYDLDNDKTKYAWADATNGKGVIYYMKDEFNNECPYDFKNVLFKRYKLKDNSGLHLADSILENSDYANPIKQAFKNWQIYLGPAMDKDNISFYYTRGVYEDGYLVSGADIYNYDRNSYESYDERNLVFNYNSGGNYVGVCKIYNSFDIIAEVKDTNGEWFYTFSKKATATDTAVDASLSKLTSVECYNNSIKEYIKSKLYYLNNNIFIVLGNRGRVYSNNFNTNCYNNTFANNCYSNTFGNSCYNNTFGRACYLNTFGDNCFSNTFGDNCFSNTFGSYYQHNTFGSYSEYNIFGSSCWSNTFESGYDSNTFGDSCFSNTFGSSCRSNTFGNNCSRNIFGDYYESNQFKSNIYGVSFELYTTGSSMKIQYLTIYKVNDNTTIPDNLITLNANYSQVLGLNSNGELVCKPALV